MLSAVALVYRSNKNKPVVLCGLIVATFLMTETRLGVTHLVTVLCGLFVYWLLDNRSGPVFLRFLYVGGVTVLLAIPVLWYFLHWYIGSGAAFTTYSLHPSEVTIAGPNMTRFFTLQEVLGL